MLALRNKILGAVVFVFSLCALQYFSELLELNREQVLAGELWRIWTGHLVHTNVLHMALDSLAALGLYFAFFSTIKLSQLLVYSFVFAPLISVSLLYFYPELDWYNGLSGLLHGLVAYFSLRLIRNGETLYWIGLAGVWLKVAVETTRASLGYESLIGSMLVISEAHLTGVFVGTVSALVGMVFWRAVDPVEREK